MDQAASVRSIDAIRDCRADLQEFCEEVRSALVDVDLEVRRSLEWVLEDQPAYWRHEARMAADAITQAKVELNRARMRTLPGGGTPSCIDEQKAVARAERRLRHAEEKIEKVRSWGRAELREVDEYTGRATQLSMLLESTIPSAVSFLDHAIASLETYLAVGDAAADAARTGASRTASPADDAAAGENAAAGDAAAENSSSAETEDVPNAPVAEPSP
jgi:hypothetical protein